MDLKERPVLPGDKIGVIEEFNGSGDVSISHGVIYSTKIGKVVYDIENRIATVRGLQLKSKIPKVGDIVTGVVESVQSNFVMVKLIMVNNEVAHNEFSMLLYLSSSPVRMRIPCKVGDIIKARVKSIKNGTVFLSITEPQLGVIKTTCVHCGGNVVKIKANLIKCTICGQVDYRKLSSEFQKGERKRNIGEFERGGRR